MAALIEDLTVVALLLDEDESQEQKRWKQRDDVEKRETEGEFHMYKYFTLLIFYRIKLNIALRSNLHKTITYSPLIYDLCVYQYSRSQNNNRVYTRPCGLCHFRAPSMPKIKISFGILCQTWMGPVR